MTDIGIESEDEGIDMTDEDKLELLLKPVKSRFRAELELSLPTFIDFGQKLSENAIVTSDACDAVKALCHKIAGSSKTLGFDDLGVAAFKVEKCIAGLMELDQEDTKVIELNEMFSIFLSIAWAVVKSDSLSDPS